MNRRNTRDPQSAFPVFEVVAPIVLFLLSGMTYDQAVAWLQQFMRFTHATGAEQMLKDASDVLAVLEREHEEAERYRALKESVDDGELIVCYNDHHEGGDIGGPECIDDWCDAHIETFGAASEG